GGLLARFLLSDYGLAMRATGGNARTARAQGVDTRQTTYVGMAISNAMVALAGALFAQMNGFADVTIGTGTIVVGLAAVIIGEAPAAGGRVVIDDQDVTGWPPPRRARLVARVFQDPLAGSCADLTIEENLALAAARGRKRGLALAVDRRRHADFRERLRRLGL